MKPAVENIKYQIDLTYGDDGVVSKIEYIDVDGEIFVRIILLEKTIPGYDIIVILGLILLGGVVSIFFLEKEIEHHYLMKFTFSSHFYHTKAKASSKAPSNSEILPTLDVSINILLRSI